VSAALAAIATKSFLPLPVYLTLIPVMGGVALSSVSELTFSWKSFIFAMMSNVASSSRGIMGKKTFGKRLGKNLNASNLYAVLTLLSCVLLIPVTALIEGPLWRKHFSALVAAGEMGSYAWQTFLAAFCYYTYNEVSFLCLNEVSPVSHAIGKFLNGVIIYGEQCL
jgi:solute carrier family 35 protein E1